MKKQNSIFYWSVLGVIVAGFVLSFFIRLPFVSIHPIEGIPSDSPLFWHQKWDTEANSISQLPFQNWSFFQQLQKDKKSFERILDAFDIADRPASFYATIREREIGKWNALFIVDNQKIATSLGTKIRSPHQKMHQFESQNVYEYHFEDAAPLFYSCYRNIVIFSTRSFSVEDAISQLFHRSSNFFKATRIKKIRSKSAVPDGLQLYVPTAAFTTFLKPYVEKERYKEFAQICQIWDWIQLSFRDNGDTYSIDGKILPSKKNSLPKQLLNTSSQQLDFLTAIPDNVSVLQTISISTDDIENSDFERFFQPTIKEQITFGILEPFNARLEEDMFLLLTTKNIKAAEQGLEQLAEKANLSPGIDYNGFRIRQVETNAFEGTVFGDKMVAPYYTFLNEYLLFCNSKANLQLWIDKYIVGQTLSNKEESLMAIQNVDTNFQAAYYLNTNYIETILEYYFRDKIREIQRIIPRLGASFISINTKNKTYTIKGNWTKSDAEQSTSIVWRYALNAEASSAPKLVRYKGEKAFIIQDKSQHLHLIDKGGKKIWTRPLEEKILSNIEQLDFKKNGQYSFIFNTSSAVHCWNEEGEEETSFPIRLHSPATNAMLVVDFEKTKQYSFFVACENQNVYGFDQVGRPLTGWNPKFKVGQITEPLIHFQRTANDYIAAITEGGKVMCFRRNGEERFPPLYTQPISNRALDYENSALSSRMIVAQQDGRVRVINTEGNAFYLKVGQKGMDFVFAEVIGDARKDYIVLNDTLLSVSYYTKNGFQKAYSYTFDTPQDQLFKLTNKKDKTFIGTLSASKKQINLLQSDGTLHPDFPLAGTTPFILTNLFTDEQDVLVVAYDNSVYAYLVE